MYHKPILGLQERAVAVKLFNRKKLSNPRHTGHMLPVASCPAHRDTTGLVLCDCERPSGHQADHEATHAPGPNWRWQKNSKRWIEMPVRPSDEMAALEKAMAVAGIASLDADDTPEQRADLAVLRRGLDRGMTPSSFEACTALVLEGKRLAAWVREVEEAADDVRTEDAAVLRGLLKPVVSNLPKPTLARTGQGSTLQKIEDGEVRWKCSERGHIYAEGDTYCRACSMPHGGELPRPQRNVKSTDTARLIASNMARDGKDRTETLAYLRSNFTKSAVAAGDAAWLETYRSRQRLTHQLAAPTMISAEEIKAQYIDTAAFVTADQYPAVTPKACGCRYPCNHDKPKTLRQQLAAVEQRLEQLEAAGATIFEPESSATKELRRLHREAVVLEDSILGCAHAWKGTLCQICGKSRKAPQKATPGSHGLLGDQYPTFYVTSEDNRATAARNREVEIMKSQLDSMRFVNTRKRKPPKY